MLALLRKDIYVLRRGALSVCSLLVIFLLLSLWTSSAWYPYAAVMLVNIALSQPLDAAAWDERCGWNRFAATTPLRPWQMVLSRYLLAYLLLAVALGLVLPVERIIFRAVWSIHRTALAPRIMWQPMVMLVLLADAVVLPAVYRLGVRRGRLVLLLLGGAAAAVILGGAVLGRAEAMFGWLGDIPAPALTAGTGAVLLVLNALSILLSIYFCRRRLRGCYDRCA